MKFLEDQFRTRDATDPQPPAPIREEREARNDHDGPNNMPSNDVFNQNSLLKKLMQQEVSEGM